MYYIEEKFGTKEIKEFLKDRDSYLLTFHCSQKSKIISKEDIKEGIDYLLRTEKVNLHLVEYEHHGLYDQLHAHALVSVKKGFRYSGYTSWGTEETHNGTYIIHWKKIVNIEQDIDRIISYIKKNQKIEHGAIRTT